MIDSEEDFAGKYRSAGLGSVFVKQFFQAVEDLIAQTEIRKGNVLEVGCAQGDSTQRLQAMLSPATSFHASELLQWQAVCAHRRLAEVTVCCESIYNLARANASVNLILALEVLEHLHRPDAALVELHRVVRDFCIISVPREPLWRVMNMVRGKYLRAGGNTPGHLNHWSATAIKRFAGRWFYVLSTRTPLPWTVLLLKPIR